jgi:hypothetical protein
MNDADVTRARSALAELDGKALDEAAQTYLLGALDADLPQDVEREWRASFADEDEARAGAEQAVDRLASDPERAELLRLAMLRTLDERPETAPLFVASVEQAGQSMFIAELGAVTLAAALLLREYHRKGRAREIRRTETTAPDGTRTVTETDVTYASDGPLAQLLVRLGLGGQAP